MFKPSFCAAALVAFAALAAPALNAQTAPGFHPKSIQPETTLSINANAAVKRAPDLAILSGGVQTDAKTAAEAIAENAKRMDGVFKTLDRAGVGKRDIQTSNFSLQPRYDYDRRKGEAPLLVGYTASNQITVRVRDMEKVGATIDAMVSEGGNVFSGVRFALDDPSEALNEARRTAMGEALDRAELYADAAGLSVKRIVTINERSSGQPRPQPLARAQLLDVAAESATQIAGGEISYDITVSVLFELE